MNIFLNRGLFVYKAATGRIAMNLEWKLIRSPYLLSIIAVVTIFIFSQLHDIMGLIAVLVTIAIFAYLLFHENRIPDSARFIDFGSLKDISIQEARKDSFDWIIFNIELNTFKKDDFWKTLCAEPNLKSIKFILPPNIYKRLEKIIADDENIKRVFDEYREIIKIIPAKIADEWEQTAFALFKREKKKKSCLLFPKIKPFSIKSETDLFGKVWNYDKIGILFMIKKKEINVPTDF